MIDVKEDFGAVGDGQTDDTEAIIDAEQSATNEETIFFPHGDYLVTEQNNSDIALSVYNNKLIFQGEGEATRIFGNGGSYHIFHCSNKSNIKWRDLKIDTVANGYSGIYFESSNYNVIEDCNIAGGNNAITLNTACYFNRIEKSKLTSVNSDAVILTNSCKYNKILHNEILNCGDSGIGCLTNSDWNSILDNIIHGTTGAGVCIDGSYYNAVSHNQIYNTSNSGIVFVSAEFNEAMDNIINECGLTGNNHGILLQSGANSCKIGGNFIRGSSGYGIYVYNSNYVSLVDNSSYLNLYDGIKLNGADHCSVAINKCWDNDRNNTDSYDGIRLITSGYNDLDNNDCFTTTGSTRQRYGINIENSYSNKNKLHGNKLLSNKTGALNDSGTNTILNDNVTQ